MGAHVRQRFRPGSSVEVQFAVDAGNTDRAVDLRGWRCSFLLPVYPDGGSSVLRFVHDRKISSHRRGVCLSNLSCPKTVKLGAITAAPTVLHTLQMALLNACFVLNKTFILNDFILHNALDFLFITETWINGDEWSPCVDICLPDYILNNTPRQMGRGGGLATVSKQQHKCHRLSTTCYSSFEVQLLRLEFHKPVLAIVVYRPPKYSPAFIQEFSEFLSTMLLLSDYILLVGDFNIHICCPGKPLVKIFSDLMDS